MPEYSIDQKIIESIRTRPGMYFGSVGSRGVEQFVYELVSNVIDLYLANKATFAHVEINDSTISVVDDGVGFPFDEPSDLDGVSLATKFFTHVHWRRSQDGHVPHVHIKRLGIGIAPLNIASNRLTVRSWRSGLLWEQHFSRGVPESVATVVEQGNGRGTKIEVIPDAEIFGEAKPRLGVIRAALFEAVHLYSGLKIEFHQERFHAPMGLQMLGFMLLNPLTLSTNPDTLPFHVTLREENLFIEAAIFGEGLGKSIFSWVNGARTPDGGSHVEGLLQALKDVNWKPEVGLIHLLMLDPNFAGPSRTKLDVPQIRKAIRNALCEPLRQYRSALNR